MDNQIAQLKKKEHYLEVINQFATLLLHSKTIDDIVWTVAKNAIGQLGYLDCVVYLLDEKSDYLIQRAAHGPKNPVAMDILNPIKIKLGEGIVGNVALKQKGEIVNDTSTDNRYILDENMGLSEIAVPIIYQDKVLGVIDSEHPEKNFYPSEDLDILTTIASMTATKIIQARNDEKILEYQTNLEWLVKQKTEELNSALTELRAQTHELTDSITYARHIQKAILRHPRSIKDVLSDGFFFYKPKDIVGGDFYLIEENEGKIIHATADCTGHGVPGAFVSIVCCNALRRALTQQQTNNAAGILELTRSYVIETFAGSDTIKDGMDIALCIIDPQTREVNYAGANISLHFIHKNQLHEIKGDKQPIGKHVHMHPFTNHQIQLDAGDALYTFTDGIADQFGGPKGKKFKYKQLRELITSAQTSNMQQQGKLIQLAFESWKGDLAQVDDVCVTGIKL